MSTLSQAFAQARTEGSILPVFEPLLEARLFIVGALDGNGRPNITLKSSPIKGNFCATVSEKPEWLEGVPDGRKLPITGLDLLKVIGDNHDILFVYDNGGDVLHHENVAAFRKAID